jgi:hypothetical protein
MANPQQVTGRTSTAGATNGYTGWTPDPSDTVYSVRNGSDGTAATAYADSTAYAVGKTVTYQGVTYVVRTAVLNTNTTKPNVNASFAVLDNHRGPAETLTVTTEHPQYYR